MEIKLFEIRDVATFIPAIAISLERADGYLVRRAGYGHRCIMLGRLEGGRFSYDPYDWDNRTFHTAHKHIEQNWDSLVSEQVIDVEFILGETSAPKPSENTGFYNPIEHTLKLG